MRMDQITERLPGIIAIHNDICVFGKTQEQHDKHLLQLTENSIGKRTSLQQQKISDKQATDYIFWHNLLSQRDEARSHKDTGIARPSDTTDPETITVIPGTCKLFATIPSRYCCQDHFFVRTSF